jgi:hypothetical protein
MKNVKKYILIPRQDRFTGLSIKSHSLENWLKSILYES